MKNDYWNKESTYSGSVRAFNTAYAAFGDHWRRSHRLCQPPLIL